MNTVFKLVKRKTIAIKKSLLLLGGLAKPVQSGGKEDSTLSIQFSTSDDEVIWSGEANCGGPVGDKAGVPTSGQAKTVLAESTSLSAEPERAISDSLTRGTTMIKVSPKNLRSFEREYRIDLLQGRIMWNSRDKGKFAAVDIEWIKEIRTGDEARIFFDSKFTPPADASPATLPQRWFSLIYVQTGRYKSLNLIAPTVANAKEWIRGLNCLLAERDELLQTHGAASGLDAVRKRSQVWLRKAFTEADRNGDNKLNLDEVAALCHRLNVTNQRRELKRLFEKADCEQSGYLDFEGFERFFRELRTRKDVEEIFGELVKGKKRKRCVPPPSMDYPTSGKGNSTAATPDQKTGKPEPRKSTSLVIETSASTVAPYSADDKKHRQPESTHVLCSPTATGNATIDYPLFRRFLREVQLVDLPEEEMLLLFHKYSDPVGSGLGDNFRENRTSHGQESKETPQGGILRDRCHMGRRGEVLSPAQSRPDTTSLASWVSSAECETSSVVDRHGNGSAGSHAGKEMTAASVDPALIGSSPAGRYQQRSDRPASWFQVNAVTPYATAPLRTPLGHSYATGSPGQPFKRTGKSLPVTSDNQLYSQLDTPSQRSQTLTPPQQVASASTSTPSAFACLSGGVPGETATQSALPSPSQRASRVRDIAASRAMGLEGFCGFLMSADNPPYRNELYRTVCMDMTRPLCDYWIATSHNTYLLGDQITGASSVEAYVRALQAGCRCIEIDCWDGPNGEPIIYHGHTLTSRISFLEAITAIKRYAFTASPYPLILSFENHCSIEQQNVMARMMKDVFGEALVKTPLGMEGRKKQVAGGTAPSNLSSEIRESLGDAVNDESGSVNSLFRRSGHDVNDEVTSSLPNVDSSSHFTGTTTSPISSTALFDHAMQLYNTTLPSPESLKRKIIVKGKKLPPNTSEDDYTTDSEDEDGPDSYPSPIPNPTHTGAACPVSPFSMVSDLPAPSSPGQAESSAWYQSSSSPAVDDSRLSYSPGGYSIWPAAPSMTERPMPDETTNGPTAPTGGGAGASENIRDKFSKVNRVVSGAFQWCRSSGSSGSSNPNRLSSGSTVMGPYPSLGKDGNASNASLPSSSVGLAEFEHCRRGSTAALSRSSSGSSGRSRAYEKSRREKKQKIARKLAKLAVYCQSSHFRGFDRAKVEAKPYHIVSFSERVALPMARQQRDVFIEYHRRHLSRVYPSGFRVNSSNFDPLPFWAAGMQLVALNYQTPGRSMQINNALFSLNKGTGYVLKPEFMRTPSTWTPRPRVLTIEIISGQQLPKPKDSKRGEIIDPFVEVELVTTDRPLPNPADVITAPPAAPGSSPKVQAASALSRERTGSFSDQPQQLQKYRTKTVVDNGFNPVWREKFKFRFSSPPELTFLRFEVYDEDVQNHDFIGSFCLCYVALLPGYRHLPLNNWKGEPMLFGSLFIRTKTRDER